MFLQYNIFPDQFPDKMFLCVGGVVEPHFYDAVSLIDVEPVVVSEGGVVGSVTYVDIGIVATVERERGISDDRWV